MWLKDRFFNLHYRKNESNMYTNGMRLNVRMQTYILCICIYGKTPDYKTFGTIS